MKWTDCKRNRPSGWFWFYQNHWKLWL